MRGLVLLCLALVFVSGCLDEKPVIRATTTIATTTTQQTTTTTLPALDYLVYTSPDYGVRIKYPREWILAEDYLDYIVVFYSPREDYFDEFFENVNIVADLHEGFIPSAEEFSVKSAQGYASRLEDYKQVEVAGKVVNGNRVIKHVLTYTLGNLSLKAMQYLFFISDYSYVLTYTAEEDRFSKYLPIVEAMFESFEKAVSLHVRTDKQAYYPGEEIRVVLTNTGMEPAVVKDDLCRQPSIRFYSPDKTLLRVRRPSCACSRKVRETLIGLGESKTYLVYANQSILGWNQLYYDVLFFYSLCSDPSYEKSLDLDGRLVEAGLGDYSLEVDYYESDADGGGVGDKFTSKNTFSIIPVPTTTTLPLGPFILEPGNRDSVTLTEDDTGFNVTVFNNGRTGLLSVQLKAFGQRDVEYRVEPFVFHINPFEKKVVHVYVNPFEVHNGDNITLYLEGFDYDVMVSVRKDVVAKFYGGFPSMPVFDPLADQKKYQHGKKSPWD
jgi:hypothetical protein